MKTYTACRVCEGSLEPVLSLGDLYVSDFVSPDDSGGYKAPLELVLCRRCRLLQLKHTVPAEAMYRNYWYRSGTNQTMRDALSDIANKAESLAHLGSDDAVLDIGCNDGTLLTSYKTGGIYKIGFDPAKNLAEMSRKVADTVVADFFSAEEFRKTEALSIRAPKIITSIAMFYDLDDPRKFVGDIKRILHNDGLWVVQMSYLPLMIQQNELGNICHEHLEYYSLHSLEYLLDLYDFEVVDIELNDINGGSFRTYIRNRSANKAAFGDEVYRNLASERVRDFREREIKMGLDELQVYSDFAFWAERIKRDTVEFIANEVRQGKKVYVYGASTKGNTILQYYGLDESLVSGAAERNPDKWGKITVGSRIPIVSEEDARAAKPDYFLVLPWHFLDEFKMREREYLHHGGRFITPAPHFRLI
jgi:NDP-4-keto-2,6-dideoxyhexose 3-C-methyltransferase